MNVASGSEKTPLVNNGKVRLGSFQLGVLILKPKQLLGPITRDRNSPTSQSEL